MWLGAGLAFRAPPRTHRNGRSLCREDPRPVGAAYRLSESAVSPFHSEPEHDHRKWGNQVREDRIQMHRAEEHPQVDKRPKPLQVYVHPDVLPPTKVRLSCVRCRTVVRDDCLDLHYKNCHPPDKPSLPPVPPRVVSAPVVYIDRKSTRLNSSHLGMS